MSAGAGQVATTVDGDRSAGDPTRLIRREKANEIGKLLGSSYPAERVSGFAALQESLVRLLFHTGFSVEIGEHHPGVDGIDPHSLFRQLERRVQAGWAVAFKLHPTSIQDLLAIADAEQVMPPKSTWFEPKLRSGLLTYLI